MAEKHTAATADTLDSANIVATLKRRMIDHCLPLWSTEGWDDKAGGFIERLDRDGRADRLAPRRVRVQARQIYCYAKAAQMGWYPEGRAIALKGLEHLLAKAKGPDRKPGFVHTLKPDGTVLDPLRDSYDHAFVLLALQPSMGSIAMRRFAPRSTRCAISSNAIALPSRRRSRRIAGVDAAAAESADAPVRSDDAAFDATHDMAFQNRAGNFFSPVSGQPLRQAAAGAWRVL